MNLILSPSKRQIGSDDNSFAPYTVPAFQDHALRIAAIVSGYTPKVLRKRLSLSEKLSSEVHRIWQDWDGKSPDGVAAVELFQGDVYDGLDFNSMSDTSKKRAADRIIILSALYGALRGSDAVNRYRLDLKDDVKVGRKSLQVFWKPFVSKWFDQIEDPLIDLSSSEYLALLSPAVRERCIRIDFKEDDGGKLKTVSFFAKKARGTFARWCVETDPTSVGQLKEFDKEGYMFNPEASSGQLWIFSRPCAH